MLISVYVSPAMYGSQLAYARFSVAHYVWAVNEFWMISTWCVVRVKFSSVLSKHALLMFTIWMKCKCFWHMVFVQFVQYDIHRQTVILNHELDNRLRYKRRIIAKPEAVLQIIPNYECKSNMKEVPGNRSNPLFGERELGDKNIPRTSINADTLFHRHCVSRTAIDDFHKLLFICFLYWPSDRIAECLAIRKMIIMIIIEITISVIYSSYNHWEYWSISDHRK